MIRTGYEDMLDPELDRRCRADELASCGVLLQDSYKPDYEELAGSEPTMIVDAVAS